MKDWSTTKKIVVALIIIAVIMIIWNWNKIFGTDAKLFRVGGSIGGIGGVNVGSGSVIGGVEIPGVITPRPNPGTVDSQVIINPPIVSERSRARCCDWLDMAAYQACLAQGYGNCGQFLSNCSQLEKDNCGQSSRNIVFTIDQINTESKRRNIPDNIRVGIINSRR